MATGDDQLVSYILRAREKGRSDDQIARSLYSVGWRKERVDSAFSRLSEMKKSGEQPEQSKEDAPHIEQEERPEQKQRIMLSSARQQPQRAPIIFPPPIQQRAMPPQMQRPQATPPQQPSPPAAAPEQPQLSPSRQMLPTIPLSVQQASNPIDLPHGPDYRNVKDESQVQNPAFHKVAGGISTIDWGFIGRVVAFLIILGLVAYGYFYLVGTGTKIS